MRLLKRLFSREDRFSILLEASAAEGKAHVKALHQLLNSPSPAVSVKAFLQARAKEQELNAEIDALLCQGRATPLERGDVEALARALHRIPKSIRKFAERYLLCAAHLNDVSFAPQLQMLESATDTLYHMVSAMKGGLRVAPTKKQNNILQRIEGDADKLFVESMVALYQGRHEPMKALMLKDLYEQLDRIFDRCRNTGDLVLQIVLRNS